MARPARRSYIEHLPLNLNLAEDVRFPKPRPYTKYPFDDINNLRGSDLVNLLRRYLMSCLRVSHVVKPFNFTNFTIRELQNQYCVSDYQFLTHGLYFFHHFLPHPQKLNKLNKDMTQKSRDRSVECCLWKRCGDKIASVKSRWGGGDVGQRVTYKLYERLITGRETQIGYLNND